jgi:hypothetical protein
MSLTPVEEYSRMAGARHQLILSLTDLDSTSSPLVHSLLVSLIKRRFYQHERQPEA